MRVLRRFLLLIVALLVPVYAVSFTENLEIPAQWHVIMLGDSHEQVRNKLRASGLSDYHCEWLAQLRSVRCTLVGRHHAAGVVIRFDGSGTDARVEAVDIREPVYTGPFHWHARLRGTG